MRPFDEEAWVDSIGHVDKGKSWQVTTFGSNWVGKVTRSRPPRAMSSAAGHPSVPTANCKEANALLSKKGHQYLDVRTPEEYQAGRVPGAVNVPVWLKSNGGMQPNPEFMNQVTTTFSDKGSPLVVGCKSGRRSEEACDLMTKTGYTKLVNMPAGFDGWVAEHLPVEK